MHAVIVVVYVNNGSEVISWCDVLLQLGGAVFDAQTTSVLVAKQKYWYVRTVRTSYVPVLSTGTVCTSYIRRVEQRAIEVVDFWRSDTWKTRTNYRILHNKLFSHIQLARSRHL